MNDTKKRWLSLFVENRIGVLAKISGLFSSKLYNLDSLTVGETEDPTISRMTIGLTSDDKTFEQITKQLNRSIEVIKVIDITAASLHSKEVLFVKINSMSEQDKKELYRLAGVYPIDIVDYDKNRAIVQMVQCEERNNELINLLRRFFLNRIEVVRGGAVAIESFF
ncbi:MAG: acetolactate synthase small subunit [Fastidiosipilaceae bacterium]|jgi:acetolactate synthase-1/3 small subunit